MVDLELYICSVGAKALEVVLEKHKRVEHIGSNKFMSRRGSGGTGEDARVLEVDGGGGGGGGGEQEREEGQRMEGELSIGGRIGAETEGDVFVRVRVGIGEFFNEALEANRTERLGFVGDGDSPGANVTEVRLSSADDGLAGRHGF